MNSRFALYGLLLALGLAGNYFKYPLFLEIEFLFGSIFAFLALQYFGKTLGIAAGVMIAGVTYFNWGHPYAVVIMSVEVAVVAVLTGRYKLSLVLADALYWLLVGMPLVYFFYHGVMEVPLGTTTVTMTKQAVNGITNVLLARLIFLALGLATQSYKASLREILHGSLVFCVLIPMLLSIAIDSRGDFLKLENEIRTSLAQEGQNTRQRLGTWIEDRSTTLGYLAVLAKTGSQQQMQTAMDQARATDGHFVGIGLSSRALVTVAYSPLQSEMGRSNVGVDLSDRPFWPEIKRTLQPRLSELVVGKLGSPKPIVAMFHPVDASGEFNGVVSGVLNLNHVNDYVLKSVESAAIFYTLLDKNGLVILTNRKDQQVMTPLVRAGGDLTRLDAKVSQWSPKLPSATPFYVRFKQSMYVSETPVGALTEWTLVLEKPMAPVQQALSEIYTRRLTLVLVFLFIGTVIAELISRKMARSSEQLRLLTLDLPTKLAAGQHIQWPASSTLETASLIGNFQAMAQSLQAELTGKQQVNTELERRVEERTQELVQRNNEIRHLAFYDQLTQLPNRRLLIDRLQQSLLAFARSGRQGALLFLDLDNFKTLNDSLGHYMGDRLLQQVGQRLVTCVREGDTVARLGGDEFVVMLEDLSPHPVEAGTQTRIVGEKILTCLSQVYDLDGQVHHSTPSIGAALFADVRDTVDDLLRRADLAMYQAKGAGKGALCFFDPEMQRVVNAKAVLENDLRQGIADQQLVLYFQAQVAGAGSLCGAEVLVRWQHPVRGLVSPLEFIPLAEETKLILPLGQWVLETACAQLRTWAQSPRTAHLTLAVNVSARQFHQTDFVEQVLDTLSRAGANPQRLKLEVTESLLLTDMATVIAKMSILKAQGVNFSLDDFGTGYSSLAYLKRLPLYQLKIDRSFVNEICTDSNDAAIAQAILGMGQALGLSVIAEGLETQAQHALLTEWGCTSFQGYYFGRPMPIGEFEAAMQAVL
jgi:diguanylate cyclase (GGDEF)-like protein